MDTVVARGRRRVSERASLPSPCRSLPAMNSRLALCRFQPSSDSFQPSALFSADAPAHKAKALFPHAKRGYAHSSVNRSPGKRRRKRRGSSSDAASGKRTLSRGGDRHHAVRPADRLFDVHCTQDAAADFTKENLKNYDIVMFYTTGDLPIKHEDLEYFLNDWLKQKGHGFIGFHSATDTYHKTEPYWDMIGGTIMYHPWTSGMTVTITVDDTEHPATRPFGKEFTIRDEIYRYRHLQPQKVHVLMTLNMEKCWPELEQEGASRIHRQNRRKSRIRSRSPG